MFGLARPPGSGVKTWGVDDDGEGDGEDAAADWAAAAAAALGRLGFFGAGFAAAGALAAKAVETPVDEGAATATASAAIAAMKTVAIQRWYMTRLRETRRPDHATKWLRPTVGNDNAKARGRSVFISQTTGGDRSAHGFHWISGPPYQPKAGAAHISRVPAVALA